MGREVDQRAVVRAIVATLVGPHAVLVRLVFGEVAADQDATIPRCDHIFEHVGATVELHSLQLEVVGRHQGLAFGEVDLFDAGWSAEHKAR